MRASPDHVQEGVRMDPRAAYRGGEFGKKNQKTLREGRPRAEPKPTTVNRQLGQVELVRFVFNIRLTARLPKINETRGGYGRDMHARPGRPLPCPDSCYSRSCYQGVSVSSTRGLQSDSSSPGAWGLRITDEVMDEVIGRLYTTRSLRVDGRLVIL